MRRLALQLSLLAALTAVSALADTQNGVSLEPSMRSSGALMDASPQHRPQMLSVFLNFPYGYYGWGFPFGVGARFYQPILHDGFLPQMNDSFGLEFGGDLIGLSGPNIFYFGLGIPVEAMWTWYLFPRFAAYVKLGFALELRFGNWCYLNNVCSDSLLGFSPILSAGGIVKLTDTVFFRFEVGYPGLKVGLGFPL